MTIQSLQKIISLEKELFAAEQAAQEKAALWLKNQQAEILRQHEKKLFTLEETKEKVRVQAATEAAQKASVYLLGAKARAEYLDGIDDDVLRHYLEKLLKTVTGQRT